jgi:putative membrane protein
MSFLAGDGKAALTRAIAAFEAETSAELVVVVEARAGHYLHVGALFGALGALACLAFLLYGEPSFSLHWFLVDPLLVGLVTAYLGSSWPALERALTPLARREAWVLRAARAAFVARAVADTRDRTGVLCYVAVAERRAVVLADLGVRKAIPTEAWSQACAPLVAAVARGANGVEVAPLLVALGKRCGAPLPRQHDDENELADEVHE